MSKAYAPEVLAVALPAMIEANPQLISTGRFYIVEQEQTVIGCGGWSFDTPGTGVVIDGIAHIRHFAIDPEHGRNGIGQAIFERCREAAFAAGAKKFQAFSSLNAEPFYQRMGLNRHKLINVQMGKEIEFPVVFMEGALRSDS
ncbi:MAG: GNAT family N-acetyltransferase [Pseudomonadota bacterium]